MRACIGERRLEERTTLLYREPVILRVANHVGPAKIPRLEGGSDSEKIIELSERDEMFGAGPASEDLVVVGREIFARPLCQVDPGRAATDGDEMTARAPHEMPFLSAELGAWRTGISGEIFIDSRDIQNRGSHVGVGGRGRQSKVQRAPGTVIA